MNRTIKNMLARINGINVSDAIYGGILVTFFIVIGGTFIIAVRFISSNINTTFTRETSGAELGLNKSRYERIAEKLGIGISPTPMPPTGETAIQEHAEVSAPTETPAAESGASAPAPLDRNTLTLFVKNSTTKSGAASVLAQALQKAGFAAAKTGNEPERYAVTTIVVKENKYAYAPILLAEVVQLYAGAIATSTADTAPYDATIIIGEK